MFILGKIAMQGKVYIEQIARLIIKDVGYTSTDIGFDYLTSHVNISIDYLPQKALTLSPCYHCGVGYATSEYDDSFLPATLVFANKICIKLKELRKSKELLWLRPDCKSQVTMEYKRLPDGMIKPVRVFGVVISTQHGPNISNEVIRKSLIDKVIKEVIPSEYLDARTLYHINPSGIFQTGGPSADSGVTGRKQIVDMYGGWAPHVGKSMKRRAFIREDAGFF